MERRAVAWRGIVLAVILSIVAIVVTFLATPSPVYSVAQVRSGLLSAPKAWLGRTVHIRGLDYSPGGQVAWLVDRGQDPASEGLPITIGQWQSPAFPRSFIWWLSSNVPIFRGIDGGRVEVYRITLTAPLRSGCPSCSVGHG